MVQAPTVDYPLGRGTFLFGLLWATWFALIAIDLGWLLSANAGDWRPWCGIVVTNVCALVALWQRPLTCSGTLTWDSSAWWWNCQGRRLSGRVVVRLDIQFALLVRFVSDGGSGHWLWLERKTLPARWLALRRAVQAAGVVHADGPTAAAGPAVPR